MSSIEYDQVYDNTLRMIGGKSVQDVFEDPLTKEKVDQDLLDRAFKSKTQHEVQKDISHGSTTDDFTPMINAPVSVVLLRVLDVVRRTSEDLYAGKNVQEVFSDDRRLYQGLFVVFTSLCFIILYKA